VRRLERLHAITNHLRARSPRPVSASALAERFGVSTRTIERDLRSLQNADVPIYATSGRLGGYAVLTDFTMPPVQLSAQEAAACVAALALLDRSPYAHHARTALDKLTACLPAAVREAEPRLTAMSIAAPSAVTTSAWVDAMHDHRLVELTYADDPTPRSVEPYTALEAAGRWYLVGWCRRSRAVRGFRVERITSLKATPEPFAPVHSSDVAQDLAGWQASQLT
jgi:proteasome accessory factor B